jgi:hypothetical protein
MLFGDGDTSLIGRYLWPDAEARGPGFRAVVEKDAVRLTGPLSDDEVLLSCLDLVSLNGVAEAEPLKMTFSLEQFWATLALLDAYRISLLRRRLSRQGGYPAGVSGAGLAEAWKAGMAVMDPGWSVSLFALLRPDLVPAGFEAPVSSPSSPATRAIPWVTSTFWGRDWTYSARRCWPASCTSAYRSSGCGRRTRSSSPRSADGGRAAVSGWPT